MLASSSFVGFIPVRDAVVGRAFYEGTLGLTVVEDTPFALVVDANGTQVRITPVPDLAPQPFTIAGLGRRRYFLDRARLVRARRPISQLRRPRPGRAGNMDFTKRRPRGLVW